MAKKTVVFDFDGVIHSYVRSGRVLSAFLTRLYRALRKSLPNSMRPMKSPLCVSTQAEVDAINHWLYRNGLAQYVDKVCMEKPPAIVYIDDRAICFDGDTASLAEKVRTFKPWTEDKR